MLKKSTDKEGHNREKKKRCGKLTCKTKKEVVGGEVGVPTKGKWEHNLGGEDQNPMVGPVPLSVKQKEFLKSLAEHWGTRS